MNTEMLSIGGRHAGEREWAKHQVTHILYAVEETELQQVFQKLL